MRDPIGVLLINVGTPEAPTAAALRRYLAQFLGDRRIIDYPRWLWLPILHGIILNVRPRRSARLYQNIWTKQGSPLLVIMRQQAEALRHQLLATTDRDVIVEIGLCYGAPSVAEGLHRLHQKGADQILLFPLYPQYSATTTAAGLDAAMAELTSWVELPEIHWTQAYHQHPGYLDALSQSIRDYWDQEGLPDRLLFSFHGIPERYERLGDPYRRHCQHTAEQVATRLGLQHEQWQVAYQSRFGPEPWLQPYTDEVLAAWAEQKINSVHAIAPGFSADCLETLDEIDREYRELFEGTSGGRFHYIPALNTRPDHIEALAEIAATAIRGWLKPSSHTPLKHTREAASP